MLYLVGGLVLLATSLVGAVWSAMRSEHLLVLHWDRIGYFFFERRQAGRYEMIPPARAPRAVGRHVHRSVAESLSRAGRAVRGWAHAHKPHVLGAKI